MARTARHIISGKVYEICFRAREGLPLPPTRTINAIIKSSIARTQRDCKVILCHYIWMSNHPHLILVAQDAEQCMRFYAEIQKRITDAIKRLLGRKFLRLWEGRPMVAQIADLDAAKDRIAYLYGNPSSADLVDNIDQFPGVSTWHALCAASNTLDFCIKTDEPWVRLPTIQKLPTADLSDRQDRFFSARLLRENKESHELLVVPNAWLKAFGVESSLEIERINSSIKAQTRTRETASRARRIRERKQVVGAARLRLEPILKPHKPQKKAVKIFVLASINELRMAIIKEHKEFCRHLRSLYQTWKCGDCTVSWPPGAFRPPGPPLANAI